MEQTQPLITARVLLDLLPIVAQQEWRTRSNGGHTSLIRNKEGECPVCAILSELGLNPSGLSTMALSALRGAGLFGEYKVAEISLFMNAADVEYSVHQQVAGYRAEMIAILNPQE